MFVLYCDYAILSACVQCCSLPLSLLLCVHSCQCLPSCWVWECSRDTSSCSWTPMDWWVIRTVEAIIYDIILVYSFCLCNLLQFQHWNVLQLYVPPHPHTCTHTPTEQSLMQSAGVDCLTSLCQLLGRMIFRGRIEQHNPMWVIE